MKKIFGLVIGVFLSVSSFCQDFKYSGPMKPEIIKQMTGFEIVLYVDCLKDLGAENDLITWVSQETMKKINKKKNYYFSIEVSTDNVDEILNRKFTLGKNRLSESEYMITIERKDQVSKVKLTEYY